MNAPLFLLEPQEIFWRHFSHVVQHTDFMLVPIFVTRMYNESIRSDWVLMYEISQAQKHKVNYNINFYCYQTNVLYMSWYHLYIACIARWLNICWISKWSGIAPTNVFYSISVTSGKYYNIHVCYIFFWTPAHARWLFLKNLKSKGDHKNVKGNDFHGN